MNKNVNFPWRSRTPSHFLILSLGVNILTASSSSSSSPHTCSCASSSADLLFCRSCLDRCCTTPTPMQSPRTLVDVLIRSLSWKSQPKSEQIVEVWGQWHWTFVQVYYSVFSPGSNSMLLCTYSIQSTIMRSDMFSVGSPRDDSTISRDTMPACGIPAVPVLTAVTIRLNQRKHCC